MKLHALGFVLGDPKNQNGPSDPAHTDSKTAPPSGSHPEPRTAISALCQPTWTSCTATLAASDRTVDNAAARQPDSQTVRQQASDYVLSDLPRPLKGIRRFLFLTMLLRSEQAPPRASPIPVDRFAVAEDWGPLWSAGRTAPAHTAQNSA